MDQDSPLLWYCESIVSIYRVSTECRIRRHSSWNRARSLCSDQLLLSAFDFADPPHDPARIRSLGKPALCGCAPKLRFQCPHLPRPAWDCVCRASLKHSIQLECLYLPFDCRADAPSHAVVVPWLVSRVVPVQGYWIGPIALL